MVNRAKPSVYYYIPRSVLLHFNYSVAGYKTPLFVAKYLQRNNSVFVRNVCRTRLRGSQSVSQLVSLWAKEIVVYCIVAWQWSMGERATISQRPPLPLTGSQPDHPSSLIHNPQLGRHHHPPRPSIHSFAHYSQGNTATAKERQ